MVFAVDCSYWHPARQTRVIRLAVCLACSRMTMKANSSALTEFPAERCRVRRVRYDKQALNRA